MKEQLKILNGISNLKVKLLSGYSNPGGSTVAHINLTNLLNKNGIDCTYYGPNPWHLDKCKSGVLKDVNIQSDDIVISHFLVFNERFPCRKHILSCHETDVYPIKTVATKIPAPFWDVIHFVSEEQKEWQGVEGVVIPNVLDDLNPVPRLPTRSRSLRAGIIGSLDRHKQPHVSIERAKKDGISYITLWGAPTDPQYFVEEIYPRLNNFVVYAGHVDDKQSIYNQIDVVYHSSPRETFNYVQAECQLTGVEYRGLDSGSIKHTFMSNLGIISKWKELLGV